MDFGDVFRAVAANFRAVAANFHAALVDLAIDRPQVLKMCILTEFPHHFHPNYPQTGRVASFNYPQNEGG